MVMAIASTAAKRANPMLVLTFIAPEAEAEAEAEAAAPVRSGTGGPVAEACTPAITGPLSVIGTSLLPIAFAAARYVVKVSPWALILPTIPIPQCEICLQKNQMGLVSVMLIVKVAEDVKPESNPPVVFAVVFAARYVQGSAKLD